MQAHDLRRRVQDYLQHKSECATRHKGERWEPNYKRHSGRWFGAWVPDPTVDPVCTCGLDQLVADLALLRGGGLDLLQQLRAIIVDFKDGTQPRLTGTGNGPGKHRRAAERREVETIHKTLNVVLAEIDKLSASGSAGPALTAQIEALLNEAFQLQSRTDGIMRASVDGMIQAYGNVLALVGEGTGLPSPSVAMSTLIEGLRDGNEVAVFADPVTAKKAADILSSALPSPAGPPQE